MESADTPLRSRPRLTGANIEHAGQHNQRVVLHAIRVAGAATRAEIAQVTGLTPATVSNITNRLLETGLLQPAGQRRGGRGQPATRLVVSPGGAFAIGVNIDRDHLTMVAVDFGGVVRARISREMAFPMPDDVRDFYRGYVRGLLADAGIAEDAISGIGVALPDDLGAVVLPGRPAGYDVWATIDIASLFAAPIDAPVVVQNDAAAAAIGEMQFGMGQHHASFFYLLVAFGLGGGVVVNSLYDHGANGRSGEIGFLIVDDGQGGRTQLQNIVSLAGLSRAFAEAGLTDVSVRQPDMRNARVAAVAHEWVARAAQALAEPLIAVSCLLNPGAVLIGGRLPIALVDELAQRTNTLVRLHGRHAPALAPVQAAALAEDSPAVGAALLSFGDLLLPADAGASRRVLSAVG
ncbi:MAG: ROK family transcriptional regulator [Sphingomonas adhaesiva]|uniref:ROK family transcriptional regulator n=1 Tax=Sphingomonas adhaesiva TaxID=28212 RepID=UPI002FF5274B